MPDSVLRLLPAELARRSLSDREIVLEHADALDGAIGHSSHHQGTVSLERISLAEAASLCRATINSAHAAWKRDPEVLGSRLYFCLTVAQG